MQNFIVLGIIPGTHIQTTLNFWIVVAIILSMASCLPRLATLVKALRRYLVIRRIARTIDHFDLVTI